MKLSRAIFAFGLLACSSFPGDARAQSAVSAWSGVSKELRDCVEVAAQRSNITLAGMIAAGVLPSDSRLTDTLRVCKLFVEGLKTNYACKLKLTNGQTVDTICNQYFGVRDGSGYRKITKDQAFRDAFTPRGLHTVTIDEEAPEGRLQREERIRQALDSSPAGRDARGDKAIDVQQQAASRVEAERLREQAETQRLETEKARIAAKEALKAQSQPLPPPSAPSTEKQPEAEQPGWSSKVMGWFSSPSNGQNSNDGESGKRTQSDLGNGKIVYQVNPGVDTGIANFIAIGLATKLKYTQANGRFFEAAIADAISHNNMKIVQETDCRFSIEARYSTASLPRQSVKWDGSPNDSAVMRELMRVDFAGADESLTKIVELEENTKIELSGKWVGYNEKWMTTRHEMGDGYAKDGAILQSPFFNVLQELSLPRLILYFPNRLGGRAQAIVSLKKIYSKCAN